MRLGRALATGVAEEQAGTDGVDLRPAEESGAVAEIDGIAGSEAAPVEEVPVAG
ncbi:hypothetical protein ABT275_31930 [Streptomyces sp. NPDC001185]|uniref:hypothetical protein n=1 Tax=Streptomyces sp. NPDC001185 TaxID=3154380 RepID=UPI0033177473